MCSVFWFCVSWCVLWGRCARRGVWRGVGWGVLRGGRGRVGSVSRHWPGRLCARGGSERLGGPVLGTGPGLGWVSPRGVAGRRRGCGPNAVGCRRRSGARSVGRPPGGERSLGVVQPRVCLSMRKVCSMSKRRRNACQARSTVVVVRPVRECHNHTGLGIAPEGRRVTSSRITVPPRMGRSPAWVAQAMRWVSRGCSRSHARAVAGP